MDNTKDIRLKKIQDLWLAHNFTQREAASILKISQSAVSQYLNGKIPLNISIVIAFAKLFQTNPVNIDSSLKF